MRILRASCGWSPSVRTLQRHFERLELDHPPGRAPAGRPSAGSRRPGRTSCGPATRCTARRIAGRKAYLFAFLDDHSRAVMAARWGYFEDSVRLAAALRPALAARGVPEAIYVDNGSAFVDAALKRAAARLGIKITHSAPGRPQGRGKIERFFGVVRQAVPGRDRRRGRRQGPGAAEQAVHRLVRDGLPRPAARRDRAAADRAVAGRRPVPHPVAGAAARGVLVVRVRGWSARTPRSSCSAASMRPTRCWPAAASSASSTRSTWPSSRSAGTASPTAWPTRSRSAATPIPRPNRRPPPRRRRRPGSTTWASSPPSTRRPPAATASATTPSPSGPGPDRAGGQEDGQ